MSLYQRIMARGEYPYRPAASPPDLLAESEQRDATGRLTAREQLGPVLTGGLWRELPGTWHLPDPYGPDPVVFGDVPRVGAG